MINSENTEPKSFCSNIEAFKKFHDKHPDARYDEFCNGTDEFLCTSTTSLQHHCWRLVVLVQGARGFVAAHVYMGSCYWKFTKLMFVIGIHTQVSKSVNPKSNKLFQGGGQSADKWQIQ